MTPCVAITLKAILLFLIVNGVCMKKSEVKTTRHYVTNVFSLNSSDYQPRQLQLQRKFYGSYGKKIQPYSTGDKSKAGIVNLSGSSSTVTLSQQLHVLDNGDKQLPSDGDVINLSSQAKLQARRRYITKRRQLSKYKSKFTQRDPANRMRKENKNNSFTLQNSHRNRIDHSTVPENERRAKKLKMKKTLSSWSAIKKFEKPVVDHFSSNRHSVSLNSSQVWEKPDTRLLRLNKIRKRRIIMAERQNKKTMTSYKNLATVDNGARQMKVSVTNRLTRTMLDNRKESDINQVYQQKNGANSLPDTDAELSRDQYGQVDRPEIQGRPHLDYPIYSSIPETEFRCDGQRYWGMYADTETRCQIWHYCDRYGKQHSFLCPNGTMFSQTTFICDWWFNVDCPSSHQLYVTNEVLSLLPAPPRRTFPEDFQGPIVDWYIFQRHQEKSYRKEKYLKLSAEGKQLRSIRFLETDDLPPWFSAKDKFLYIKLKELEHRSKASDDHHSGQPVKKALSSYRPIDKYNNWISLENDHLSERAQST